MIKRALDVKVWAIGSSLVVTIPTLTAEALKIKKGDVINIIIEK